MNEERTKARTTKKRGCPKHLDDEEEKEGRNISDRRRTTRTREERTRMAARESDKVSERDILPFSLSDFTLLFPLSLSTTLLYTSSISLAFHSSRSYLTVCTLRFLHLIRAIFSSTSSLFRHISRSFLGRSRELRPILLTLRASSTATCSGARRSRKRKRIICTAERYDYRRKTRFERSSCFFSL